MQTDGSIGKLSRGRIQTRGFGPLGKVPWACTGPWIENRSAGRGGLIGVRWKRFLWYADHKPFWV